MKFFAYLKKLNKLGASMVEYAIVLACIASLGVSVSDNLTNVLNKPFNSIASILGLANSGSETLSSMQKNAFSLFTDETKTKSNGGNRYDSFYKEFVSGAGIFMEKHLHEAGIDTAWSKDNIDYNQNNTDSVAIFQSLWKSGIIPESTKSFRLVTIADDMNVSPTKGSEFSATQYLLYASNGQVHLAATRSFPSVTVSHDGSNGVIQSNDSPGKTYNSQYHVGRSQITGTNIFTNYIDPTNHGFVAYKP